MTIRTNDPEKFPSAEAGLKQVFDPEIGVNIVDLGLVYDVFFNEEEKKITVRMTLTTEFCPMGESITGNAEEMMKKTFPGYDASIVLTFDPPWSYDRISEEGKKMLTM